MPPRRPPSPDPREQELLKKKKRSASREGRQDKPCGLDFGAMPAHLYADVVQDGVCQACGHRVARHMGLTSAAKPAPVQEQHEHQEKSAPTSIPAGPSFSTPQDPSEVLTIVLRQWRSTTICRKDSDAWESAFADLSRIAFDGVSVQTASRLFSMSGDGPTAVFKILPLERTELAEAAPKFERLETMGRAVLQILRCEARAAYFVEKAPSLLMRTSECVPVAAGLASRISKSWRRRQPGMLLPFEHTFSDNTHCSWWAVYVARTLAAHYSSFPATIGDTFERVVKSWSSANSGSICDLAKWSRDYEGIDCAEPHAEDGDEAETEAAKPSPIRKPKAKLRARTRSTLLRRSTDPRRKFKSGGEGSNQLRDSGNRSRTNPNQQQQQGQQQQSGGPQQRQQPAQHTAHSPFRQSQSTVQRYETLLEDIRKAMDVMSGRPFVAGLLNSEKINRTLTNRGLSGEQLALVPPLPLILTEASLPEKTPTPSAWRLPSGVTLNLLTEAASMGAVEFTDVQPAVLSPHFAVDQSSAEKIKWRLIFDLRGLNTTIEHMQFKLETLRDVPLLFKDCILFGKTDLTKGYFQCPVAETSRSFLGFRASPPLSDRPFGRWKVLPFGLASAPRRFQSITGAFARAWRAKGIRVMVYLDDFLWGATDLETYLKHTAIILTDLLSAGFIISSEKTVLLAEEIVFLGLEVSKKQAFRVPEDKISKITVDATALLDGLSSEPPYIDQGRLERLIGRAVFTCIAHPIAALFLAWLHHAAHNPVEVEEDIAELRDELQFWSDCKDLLSTWRPWAATELRAAPTFETRQDASDKGIGISVHDLRYGRRLLCKRPEPLPLEVTQTGGFRASSSARELYGIARGLEAIPAEARGAVVRVVCDNRAGISAAGFHTPTRGMAWAAHYLAEVATRKGVFLAPEWAPRAEMEEEDADSRLAASDMSRSKIPSTFLRSACKTAWQTEGPELDLFADVANKVAPEFCTRWYTPGAVGDGLAVDLTGRSRVWAFPPFALARAVVRKLAFAKVQPGSVLALLPANASMENYDWIPLPGPKALMIPPSFERARRCEELTLWHGPPA